jgi:hypothetical protein
MQRTWRRRATLGGLGLAVGLILFVPIAAAPSTEAVDVVERKTTQSTTSSAMGRAARGSTEFPTRGTPKLTCLDDYATRHTEWCQDWVMRLIRKGISPYEDAAGTLAP